MRIALYALLLLAAGHAHADAARARLQVSAQVVVSCRLDASVPRAGTPQRSTGAASINVTCTRGALAAAVQCTADCPPPRNDSVRTEYHLAESRGDGPAIATLLF